jgi:hypothetical protein
MDESIRTILNQFPYPRGKDQTETLVEYFEAKRTESRTNAADAADINYRTAKKFEETYEELTKQERVELDTFLLQKRVEDSDQIEADQEGLPA